MASAVDGWPRNCCKHCSDHFGWYYTTLVQPSVVLRPAPAGSSENKSSPSCPPAAPPAPPAAPTDASYNTTFTSNTTFTTFMASSTWPPSKEDLLRQNEGAANWLRRNIPESFWAKAHAEFGNINMLNRARLREYNRRLGLKAQKSFLKHASYNGAIQVPPDFPDDLIAFIDTKTNLRFCDPCNSVYRDVFLSVWPNVTWMSNKETVGDLVEAILGLAWTKVDLGETLGPEAEDFVKIVEQACLSEYLLRLYYTNHE